MSPHRTKVNRGETIARFLLTRSPLGALVRHVARLRVSVHAKLLGAFLMIALLLVAMKSASPTRWLALKGPLRRSSAKRSRGFERSRISSFERWQKSGAS
jgi:hypothetical protein